jgi:hypothetical protein
MKILRVLWALSMAGALAAAMAVTGCSSKTMQKMFVPNQPPTVRLTSAPYDTAGRYFYAYKLNWIGNDPDGRVEYFLYAIDPPFDGSPITWTKTTKNEQIIFFSSKTPDPLDSLVKAVTYHTFAIRAVDNSGDSSVTVSRAFFSYTVAPDVGITDPVPSSLTTAYVTPSVRITWQGSDPDGQLTQKPVKYKFKLISAGGEFPLDVALGSGGLEKLKQFYAPHFVGWDSISGDTTSVQYTNLTPNATYLFVVVAFDEAGAYSPIFSFDSNCLRMTVLLAAAGGPKLTIFNEYFNFTYSAGTYEPENPIRWIKLDVPFNTGITFNWFAQTDPGAQIAFYRWKLGGDVSDDTPRSNETTDIGHWSTPSLNTVSALVGPFPRDTVLFFYIEAGDNNGLKSLGTVQFHVVKPAFDHALGVINDTRFLLDVYRVGTTIYVPPGGYWPTAAEFDTFLFAHGGFPYKAYPPGTQSSPGIFKGYDYDTFSTRVGHGDLTVPLAVLGHFVHLIWITDNTAANRRGSGLNVATSVCALNYMNNRNKINTLATYVKQGGQVWMMGSGVANACQINFDRGDGGTYSADGRELVPGRFMWDIVHWRNDIQDAVSSTNGFHKPRNHPIGRYPGGPDYSLMPDTLHLKSVALGDTIPPLRDALSFFQDQLGFSQIVQDNRITENLQPDPAKPESLISTLDTVFTTVYPQPDPTQPAREYPIATFYHGVENSPIFYTSIDGWLFNRGDFVSLVDFVLQKVWKLQRTVPFGAARPSLATMGRPVRLPGASGLPAVHGGARSLVSGPPLRATRPAPPSPAHRPQE